jgi:hypothetical protein
LDAGLGGKSDEEQLVFACNHSYVLGMILSLQQRFSVGEQLRRILSLCAVTAFAEMRNRVEFLSNWG